MRNTARSYSRIPAACIVAALTTLLAGCGLSAGQPGAQPSPASADGALEAGRRADVATEALVARFWLEGPEDFAAAWPSDGSTTGYWTYAQAVDAVLDAAERSGEPRWLELARTMLDAQGRRGWSRDFFDDEGWMALALLRAHDLTGEPLYLAQATALLEDIAANASDGTCCGATPGGLWWDRPHTQKATASNAVPAIAAARLYERTGDSRWLDFARQTYGWWLGNMVDGASGQVADHLLPSGEKVWWGFTYDGGAMLGAALALHRATGDAAYLADARRLAAFMLANEVRPTPVGAVLFDGASCNGDCDQFKGIAHRYLAALAAADPDVPGLAPLLRADAEAIWTLARDPASGTFGVDWGAAAGARTSLAAQTSAAMALNLEASGVHPR